MKSILLAIIAVSMIALTASTIRFQSSELEYNQEVGIDEKIELTANFFETYQGYQVIELSSEYTILTKAYAVERKNYTSHREYLRDATEQLIIWFEYFTPPIRLNQIIEPINQYVLFEDGQIKKVTISDGEIKYDEGQ
jgi:hypothetical protein